MRRHSQVLLTIAAAFAGVLLVFQLMPVRAAGGPADLVDVNPARVHPLLLKAMQGLGRGEQIPVLVELPRAEGLLAGLDGSNGILGIRREVVARLQQEASVRAAPVLDAVSQGGGRVERVFWISPVVAIEADHELIARLSQMDGVVQLRPDTGMRIAKFSPAAGSAGTEPILEPGGFLWNLSMIRVGLVDPGLGLDGTGVVVANLDTGVDWTHPALYTRYRGYDPAGQNQHAGNWHVSTGEAYPFPVDFFGHGTHTMGIMVGEDPQGVRTGVAPGAQWIAVKMIDNQGYFQESWVHDALEWVIAPEGDPALAPDVVSSSWGTGAVSDARYRPDIQALRAAGILPIFSAGNGGPLSSTLGSPADYPESFAVGAVEDAGLVTTFSARGPGPLPWAEIKPEIVAPGADILSTVPGGGYFAAGGTSMAAPHAAGVAAILLQADPDLQPDQLEALLLQTAAPLQPPVPNNDSGWGLLDAYTAAVAVQPHGEISGSVQTAGAAVVPYPVITATHASGSPVVVVSGDAAGKYWLPLAPGSYYLEASAFGFGQVGTDAIRISGGTVILKSFLLDRLPSGALVGALQDAVNGAPVTATVSVPGTPLQQTTDAGGIFTLTLPSGAWPVEVRTQGYRAVHFSAAITAGLTTTRSLELVPAPTVLFIDSGKWYYGSKASYFTTALDTLDYVYDVREVRDPYGISTGTPDPPTMEDLLPYDLVVWSAPFDSPGMIHAGRAISGYLTHQGRLLVSGQDVALWDAGGNLFFYPDYFPDFAGAWFESEKYETAAYGLEGTPFEELDLRMNTPDSDLDQFAPDSVTISDGLLAAPAMTWDSGQPALLLSGGCHPYRFAWTGFGLEGSGPASDRLEAFARLMDWLDRPPPDYGLALTMSESPLIGSPGETVTRTLTLHNTGREEDEIVISLGGQDWQTQITLPDGSVVTQSLDIDMPGCSSLDMVISVDVPAGLGYDIFDTTAIGFQSLSDPAASRTAELVAKTAAPLLLLDDGLWFWYGDRYAGALDAIGLSYDFISTDEKPVAQGVLQRYPMVIWTTGQDWFYVLPPEDQLQMQSYLEGGGRVLLSSQEFLNVMEDPDFGRDYLGVTAPHLEITPTLGSPVAGSYLGDVGEIFPLTYPFVNWSDGFVAVPGAVPLLQDGQLNLIGASHEVLASGARSAFFSFPLEALPPDRLEDVLREGTLWLGPLSGTGLSTAREAVSGEVFPLTLTLSVENGLDPGPVSVRVPVPPSAQVVPDSLTGGWAYDPDANALIWDGMLPPGSSRIFAGEVRAEPGIPQNTVLEFPLELVLADGRRFFDQAETRVNTPQVLPLITASSDFLFPAAPWITYTVSLQNAGTASVAAMTDTLPLHSALLTDTLKASAGTVWAESGNVRWSGSLAPGQMITVEYATLVSGVLPPERLINFVEVRDEAGSRGAWAVVEVPGSLYFPILIK